MINESMAQQPAQQSGFVDRMASVVNLDWLFGKVHMTTAMAIEMLLYFGAGFFFGLLVKRYARYVVSFAIICVLVSVGFQYMGLLTFTIHWPRVKELTGIAPADTIGSLATAYMAWLKGHLRQVVSALVGFLLGFKIG